MIVWAEQDDERFDELRARWVAMLEDARTVPCPAGCQNGYLKVYVTGLEPCPLCMGRGRVNPK